MTDLAQSLGVEEFEIGGFGGMPENLQDSFLELASVASARRYEEQLLRKHKSTWLGKLGDKINIDWHLGFIRSIEIVGREKEAIATYHALLKLPVARFVRELRFSVPSHGPIVASSCGLHRNC